MSGFRREVDEIRVVLGYYAACSGDSFPMFPIFRGQKSKNSWSLDRLGFLTPDDGTGIFDP